ncbi:MAG: hypothetical protein H7196_00800 [candidate division SR1 bacterium]|nr:hypothetical protein [candidate division SR1 bacterium]
MMEATFGLLSSIQGQTQSLLSRYSITPATAILYGNCNISIQQKDLAGKILLSSFSARAIQAVDSDGDLVRT